MLVLMICIEISSSIYINHLCYLVKAKDNNFYGLLLYESNLAKLAKLAIH